MPVVPEPDMDETHNVDNNDVSGDECTVGNGYHKSGNGISNGHNGHHEDDKLQEKVNKLETKIKAQDLEIHLLKCTLADTLSRLTNLENTKGEPRANLKKATPEKTPSSQSNSRRAQSVPQMSPVKSTSDGKTKPEKLRKRNNTVDTITEEQRSSVKVETKSPTSRKKRPDNIDLPSPRTTTNNNAKKPYNKRALSAESPGQENPESNGKPKLILAKRQSIRKKTTSFNKNSPDDTKTPREDYVKFTIRGRMMTCYVPSTYSETRNEGALPDQMLQLEWVYGYRGKDSRDNLFQLQSGELVYNMAGVVVIYDDTNKKQRHYLEHTDDVKCIAIHPNQTYVASGQVAGHCEDGKPHVRVWNSENLETLSTFGHGHLERGVACVEFLNMEQSNNIVVIDEVNVVYIYDWEKAILLCESKGSPEPIFSVKSNPVNEKLFVSYGKSHLAFWTIETLSTNKLGLIKKMGIYDKVDKPKYALCVAFTAAGDVISGDSNGNILLYETGTNKPSKTAIKAHKGGVVSLYYMKAKNQILSCGKEGQISLWDDQLRKIEDLGCIDERYGLSRVVTPINNFESYVIGTSRNCILKFDADLSNGNPIVLGHSDEMWGLAVHPTEPIFATCSSEQLVCLWNSENQENIWSCLIDDSAKCAEFHPVKTQIVIGTATGKLYFLDYERQEELLTLPVSRDEIDDLKISPDSKYVAVCSRDSNIYLYTIPNGEMSFRKPKVLQGHSSRVLHIDWSIDSEFLQSNSSDYEILYWQAESGLQVLSPTALRDVEWATWTCPFGFPVMGIWPEGADGTDINACARSRNNDLVATGDDFGEVKLFKYPSVKLKSDGHVGSGHSSHVTCVRFLKEDTGLVTVGGKDCSVMQWKLVPFKMEDDVF